jgi:hypothetical protein
MEKFSVKYKEITEGNILVKKQYHFYDQEVEFLKKPKFSQIILNKKSLF